LVTVSQAWRLRCTATAARLSAARVAASRPLLGRDLVAAVSVLFRPTDVLFREAATPGRHLHYSNALLDLVPSLLRTLASINSNRSPE
jgi:hypothetical protein